MAFFEGRKPMATVLANPDLAVFNELQSLRAVGGVMSVQARWVDQDLNIWVGVRDDDDESRANVYRFENILFDKFPALSFDFHVVSLVAGRKLDDFVSEAKIVFQRSA
jgi:hypothetical protein